MSKGSPFGKAVATPLCDLKPHPQNYREHPLDQLSHIEQSIRDNGFYRNVVAARDFTILAGHGSVKAAINVGLKVVPVIRLDLAPDDPRALKILAGDNEIGKSALSDDRALVLLLQEIAEVGDLIGTGYDEMTMRALDMVTRPPDVLVQKRPEDEWVGMPEYDCGSDPFKLVISFPDAETRDRFLLEHPDVRVASSKGRTTSSRWPWTEDFDGTSAAFVDADK